jgi:amino acid adenylation domain-containing protein
MSVDRYEGIGIIGMAGRFPGAESVEEFWANLVAGKESVSYFTDEELSESGLNPTELRRRGRYVPARGLLKNAECFDAAFFGVHPKEAEVMDPQQRIFLEMCWAALERAGYPPNQAPCTVAVFGGATYNTYYQHALAGRPDLIELVGSDLVMFGNEKDYLTTRVAYKLGLKGQALNVSTACSTSLVAVAQACQSLLTYQCDMALAGGVSIKVPQKSGYYHDDGNIGSADGHTRAFDAQASGTAFSNGVALVVLRRMEDAVKDRDHIYAVIKSAALNNDGSERVSFGAPGVEGQSEVISLAHELAGVDADTITCVEAHGTATPLGDPIEVAALTQAFRRQTDAKQFCALGSVKSNIGHLDVAAGVAGLIKMALSLHHKVIPASLHLTRPNPKLDLENSPFYVNTALREWMSKPGMPRRAGVSSFGTGGTNAHIVLEEAPPLPPSGPSRPWQLLTVSAKTNDALDRATVNLISHLQQVSDTTDAQTATSALADDAFTLQTGRSPFMHRRVVACRNAADGAEALKGQDPKRVFTHHQQLTNPPVVFMFPGQGAQYPAMGAELFKTEAVFRAEVDRCAEILQPLLKTDLRKIMFPKQGAEKESDDLLVQTRFTQPALFVIEYAMATLWLSWGIKPTAMIGHSVGEYVAGYLAGVFSLEDALMLVARRGALVQTQPGGAMLAIRLPEQQVLPLLPLNVAIAAINSPNLCVASGPYESIAALEKVLEQRGIKVRHLHTSHAFHSPMMEPVLEPFTSLVRSVKLRAPSIPYVSNVTGRWITPEEAQAPEYWAGHIRQTVRFSDGIRLLVKDPEHVLLEVGPGQTLCTLSRQHPAKQVEQVVLASLPFANEDELRGLTETFGRLWMTGVTVDWEQYYAQQRRYRAVLPTYPFERKRYWPDPQAKTVEAPSAVPGVAMPVPSLSAIEPQVQMSNPPQSCQSETCVPRTARLLDDVRRLMQELSGYDLSDVDASTDLLELGFDSLLLTQAAQLIQREFGVPLTFRQLMEDVSSLHAIAAHLDASMPLEAYSARPSTIAASVPPTASPISASGLISQSVLEQILQQQQQLTNQVLQLMGRQVAAGRAESTVVQASVTPANAPSPPSKPEKSHGPFKPFDRHSTTTLTETQKLALDALIDRYTRRTAGSKRLAGENRAILADPRSVSGFNRLWKEMVYPIVSTRSDGSKVWDVDGHEYIDFVMGFGATLFGHRPPFVVEAVHQQLDVGFEIGPIQPLAYDVAALLKEFTGMSRFAFTNTGSEAVLAAMRVARTVSGRDKIAVFAGAYHGIFDEVLFRPLTVNGETRTAAIAPGIPDSALAQIIVLDYGNPQSLEILRRRGSEIAAVLVEPVQSRRLDLQPMEFLHELRRVTQQTGMALVFDEVVTGFRVHPGGAQAHFGIRADLATYGKVIGGGLPIGVVAGDSMYMDALDGGQWQYGDASFPELGVTFFAGTCVRHPLALAAARSVLNHLKHSGPKLQDGLADRTAKLAGELRSLIERFEAPYQLAQFSSLMTLTFPPDQRLAGLLFYLLRERGILIWENRNFVMTTAHSESDLARFAHAFRDSLAEMQASRFLPGSASPTVEERVAEITVVGKQTNSTDEFPLTDAQKEIWLAAKMGGESELAYNEVLKLQFQGIFDGAVFRQAVDEVGKRHQVLLAGLSEDGEWGRIHAGRTIEIPLFDLSGHEADEQTRALSRIAEEQAHKPFDLVAGPLVRAKLIKLSSDHHVVFWTAHHIVCDGWSCALIVDELSKIYSAQKRGSAPLLPTPFSFDEYARTAQPVSGSALNVIEYWKQQFAVLPPSLDLPTDRPRPLVRSAKASTIRRTFGLAIAQGLKRRAGEQRTTMVVLLMAAMKTLLHRLTGQSDLVIGLPVASQAVTNNHCLVGHCVNLLPVRTRLQPDASFLENVAAVKKSVLDAYDHHQCTIGTILRHVPVPRSADRPPLVEIIFNVDRDASAVQFDGLSFTCERGSKRALHYDFFFNFVEGPEGLHLECDYNTDLFDATTVERWIDRFQVLLEAILENPSQTLDNLPLLPAAERQELLGLGCNAREVFPHRILPEWFETQVAKTPNASAVSFGAGHLSYAELNKRSNQLAGHLKSLGVRPETLVGVLVDRSLEMVVALLGILKAGGAYVPLDPSFPADRLSYMVENSKMRVLITGGTSETLLSMKPPTVVRLDQDWPTIASHSTENLRPTRAAAENLAYVLYTSGSTGKPKGVQVTQSSLANFLCSMQRMPGLKETDILLAVTTLSFDIAGLELYLPLVTGARVVIASREEAQDSLKLMKRMSDVGCTVMQATPATWRALLNAGWTGSPTLKVICGGESFPRDLAQALLARCAEVWNVYGPTETTIWSTVHRVMSGDGQVPIGRPVANTQIYVLDARQRLVPRGVTGELCIGGDGLARGYLDHPDQTEERFIANPFEPDSRLYRTGDLARWLGDGTLQCLGRIGTQVKVRGYRIELGEIEAVLAQHEGVRQCVASPHEEAPGSRILVAYFEPHTFLVPTVEELRTHLKKQLPEYMIPSIFVKMERLPLTPNGKIDRKALPPPDQQRITSAKAFVAPSDPLQHVIANIWADTLKVQRVGLHDNFFELGGHSLNAVSMLLEVRKLTGKTLPLATLFQAPTVASLSDIVRREGWAPSWSSLVPIKPHGSKNPIFLVHGAEGNVLLYRQLSHYVEDGYPIYGLQSNGLDGKGTFDQTIEQMAARYIKEIMAIRPQGPYILGGYCMGGTIALEMAQQLSGMGERVSLVVLLETYNPAEVSRWKALLLTPIHFIQKLWFHYANLILLQPKDRPKFLAEKTSVEMARVMIRLRSMWQLSPKTRHRMYPHLTVKRLNDQAQFSYVPKTYKGRMAVISPARCFVGERDRSMGWSHLMVDGCEVHQLPIYPRGMLVEPYCRLLADVLNGCLKSIEGSGRDAKARYSFK